jgi:uncharacterized protein YbaR (Trm112 family)
MITISNPLYLPVNSVVGLHFDHPQQGKRLVTFLKISKESKDKESYRLLSGSDNTPLFFRSSEDIVSYLTQTQAGNYPWCWTIISLPIAFRWESPVELKIGLSEYVIDKDGTPHCLKCDSSNLIYCEEEDVVYNSEFSNGEIIVQGVNSQFTVQKMLYCQSCKIDYKIPDSITVNWDNY